MDFTGQDDQCCDRTLEKEIDDIDQSDQCPERLLVSEKNKTDQYPERPVEPLASDCCGSGCIPCVFDLYEQELKLWKEECRKIRQGGKEICDQEVLCPEKYLGFKLTSIKPVTRDTFMYRFDIPGGARLGLKAGQHIVLRGSINNQTITRQYTPVSELTAQGYFDVLIKLYPGGQMSQCIRSWKEGDLIQWRGPFGLLQYVPNVFSKIIMLAAGTGIAPMTQVIRVILENEDDETLISLVYACRTYEDILMKEQLDQWSGYWNFSVQYVLSQDTQENVIQVKKYNDTVHLGRLNSTLVSQMVPLTERGQVLICGTKSFDKDMINHLKKVGWEMKDIFKF
ncbi:NADH-cytochrome b5 reductase-like [Lingula anatina]|uniref:NADH-cytochrome b5 reductase n=1 Tax=Lingula anatina TaxID=7574 RepID=A0A1S3HZH9_LINAN|nr:NADH-cytochrome b5 reductase-like [Lingula anatina]|eukprot:XP_013391420.1 NADH-cytochrome b5 reductase-like [Lingula anatina]